MQTFGNLPKFSVRQRSTTAGLRSTETLLSVLSGSTWRRLVVARSALSGLTVRALLFSVLSGCGSRRFRSTSMSSSPRKSTVVVEPGVDLISTSAIAPPLLGGPRRKGRKGTLGNQGSGCQEAGVAKPPDRINLSLAVVQADVARQTFASVPS